MKDIMGEPASRPARPGLFNFVAVIVAAIIIGLLWLARPGPVPAVPPQEAAAPEEPVVTADPVEPAVAAQISPVERDYGIRVSRLALARGGSAIDLCYEIVDPAKVGLLADGTNVAYLVDVDSGSEIQLSAAPQEQAMTGTTRGRSMAKMLRLAGEFPPPSGRLVAGRSYSALLPNPSGLVKSGSRMAFVVGNARVDNLIIESTQEQ